MSAKLASCRRRNRFGTRSLILSALGFVLFAAPSALPGATTFYVDPDRTGAQTGAAASPWASFSSSAWAAINSALLANDVTVYVSALKADTTQQSRAWFLEFQRSVSSSHRLTIDGCSLWNTNAVTPSWRTNAQDISIAYTNRRVFMLTGDGASALGWTRYSTYKKQDNITMRGFEISGSAARTSFAGDNVIAEFLNIHDITAMAPALGILYTFMDDATNISQQLFPPCTNMTIRNVRIDTCQGEAIYIGSVDPDVPLSVQQQMGNQHAGITITNVFIRNPGTGGGQGDGIDCKNGITNLRVSDVEIQGMSGMGGIILPQTMVKTNQNILIERCFIHDSAISSDTRHGIFGVSSTGKYGYKGITIRNCIIARHYRGVQLDGSGSALEDIQFYNNTIYGCDILGLSVSQVLNNAAVINNLVCDNNSLGLQASISGNNVVSDYNACHGLWQNSSEGTHSISLTALQDANLLINIPFNNYTPQLGSPIIGRGQTLSSFSDDCFKSSRLNNFWDIGAVQSQYGTALSAPSAPTNLRVVGP